MEYILIFIAGVMGSFHCIGMCGAFPVALASVKKKNSFEKALYQILYSTGRIFSYTFLGAMFGLFGFVVGDTNFIVSGQTIVSVVAGVFMVLIALQIMGFLRERTIPGFSYFYRFVTKVMSLFLKKKSPLGSFYLGIFNGFLPCPLIYAFLFTSASTSSPAKGAFVMLSLGLGTVPAMFTMGIMSEIFSPKVRGRISRYIPGVVILVFGIFTIYRAFLPYMSNAHHLMHH